MHGRIASTFGSRLRLLLVVGIFCLPVAAIKPSAAHGSQCGRPQHPCATEARAVREAATQVAQAAQKLRHLRHSLGRCERNRPGHCDATRKALRHAKARLARARRALHHLRSALVRPDPAGGTTSSLQIGIVAGSALDYELRFIQTLGAHTARLEFGIDTPASALAPIVGAYASAGIRPLLLASFDGRLPTTAESRNLASWAAQFGPGGSYWQGKSEPPGTAVTDIEFGNETSYSYQFSDNSTSALAARAQTYALRFRDAEVAVHAVNPGVGLLAIADDGDQGGATWVSNMFKAVPDLGTRVAGWTVHPYGPNPYARIDTLISSTTAAGASSSIPIWVTEWGVSTDNGKCVDDNYGWNRCMTYDAAATLFQSTLSGLGSRYGNRLAAFFVYSAHDLAQPGASTSRENYFGALNLDGSSKGAYTVAVKAALASSH